MKRKIERRVLASLTAMVCAFFAHTTTVEGASVYGGVNQDTGEILQAVVEKPELEAVVVDLVGSAEVHSETYNVPDYDGMKSWMPYTAITTKSSSQWKLQQMAYTDEYGLRRVGEKYCIAIGTHFNANVGQFVNLYLKNGTIIKCVVGDIKADKDTDAANIFTSNNCMSEFIIDLSALNAEIKRSGNASKKIFLWEDPVVKIEVLDINVLEEQ